MCLLTYVNQHRMLDSRAGGNPVPLQEHIFEINGPLHPRMCVGGGIALAFIATPEPAPGIVRMRVTGIRPYLADSTTADPDW